MKVWLYTHAKRNNRIDYLYVFTGHIESELSNDYSITIEESLIEFGGATQNFQEPGGHIFLPKHQRRQDLKTIARWIIEEIFKGRFDLRNASFRAG